jgi:hypothetical protein
LVRVEIEGHRVRVAWGGVWMERGSRLGVGEWWCRRVRVRMWIQMIEITCVHG